MTPEQQEIYDYAFYMFKRGDYLGSIRKYLERSTDDEALKSQIMEELEAANKEVVMKMKNSKPINGEQNFNFGISQIIGALLVALAIIIHFAMKTEGLIGTLPIGVGLLGLAALSGKLKY